MSMIQQWIERPLTIARGALRRLTVGAIKGDAGAAPKECQRDQSAGTPTADNGHIVGPGGRWAGIPGRSIGINVAARRPYAGEHLPLTAEAFDLCHCETGGLQPAADKTGGGEGSEAGLRSCQSGHGGKQHIPPHIGVFRRREAVQKPGVNLIVQAYVQRGKQRIDIAKADIKNDLAVGQYQAVITGYRLWPEGQQFSSSASGASVCQGASALRKSSLPSGYFSTLIKCRRRAPIAGC